MVFCHFLATLFFSGAIKHQKAQKKALMITIEFILFGFMVSSESFAKENPRIVTRGETTMQFLFSHTN